MMIFDDDDYTNITPKIDVYCKALIFNMKPADLMRDTYSFIFVLKYYFALPILNFPICIIPSGS
jgi:hypothetical protein